MRAYVEQDLAALLRRRDTSWTFPVRLVSAVR
jgi:hypothetical protein